MPYLDDVLPEDDDSTFNPATDIKELIDPSGGQSGGGDAVSYEAQEATLVYVFDWRKRRSFIRFMLGFSYTSEGSPYRLYRENPQAHPTFPWLTAISIHFSSVSPTNDPELSVPSNAPNYPAVFTTNSLSKTSYFDVTYATVRFVAQPWTFRPDAYVTDVQSELERNVYFDPVPVVDLLQAEGGVAQLAFSETNPNPKGGGAKKGQVIGSSFATTVAKVTYNMHWMYVPEEYLSSGGALFLPGNLIANVTKVNLMPFLDMPAGTVLLLAPQLQRFRFPIETFDGLFPFFGWNIRIPLVYFNPPKAIPDNKDGYPDTDPNAIPRGHRCMPDRFDGTWLGATREDGVNYLLNEANLYDGFRHIADPLGPVGASGS